MLFCKSPAHASLVWVNLGWSCSLAGHGGDLLCPEALRVPSSVLPPGFLLTVTRCLGSSDNRDKDQVQVREFIELKKSRMQWEGGNVTHGSLLRSLLTQQGLVSCSRHLRMVTRS